MGIPGVTQPGGAGGGAQESTRSRGRQAARQAGLTSGLFAFRPAPLTPVGCLPQNRLCLVNSRKGGSTKQVRWHAGGGSMEGWGVAG